MGGGCRLSSSSFYLARVRALPLRPAGCLVASPTLPLLHGHTFFCDFRRFSGSPARSLEMACGRIEFWFILNVAACRTCGHSLRQSCKQHDHSAPRHHTTTSINARRLVPDEPFLVHLEDLKLNTTYVRECGATCASRAPSRV